ncbi:5-methyltetrahydropteroyltriglutamate--homocysteine S-methyltransferase [Candidatus Vidania fulgoroideorum]
MIKTHIIGLPIIGKKRELKFALESYIRKEISLKKLKKINNNIINENIFIQNKYNDVITLGFHFFVDKMIYTMINLGIIPLRFKNFKKIGIKEIIKLYKGYKKKHSLKMLKWFNTNYHYFVPEIDKNIKKNYKCNLLIEELLNYNLKKKLKLSIIGPITFCELSNFKINKKKTLKIIFNRYIELLKKINKKIKINYIQIEEPILNKKNYNLLINLYEKNLFYLFNFIKKNKIKIFFVYYFNNLSKKIINFVNKFKFNVFHFNYNNCLGKIKYIKKNIKISLGIIDGDNIWKANYKYLFDKIKKIIKKRKISYLSSTCSFLHIPYDKIKEKKKIYKFISFSIQKIFELFYIKKNINLKKKIIKSPKFSSIKKIKNFLKIKKISNFKRKKITMSEVNIKKKLPYTTIGSFPQTKKLRIKRNLYLKKKIKFKIYKKYIKKYINYNFKIQKKIGLDCFVNGEPERSDMVDFFFKNYSGCYITKNGWVQSYGTRCVKPPIIYGNIKRKRSNINEWYYKRKKTQIIKGIVTGPITMFKWSFVRKDIKISNFIYKIANVISKEIKDLMNLNYNIIQIDEPALKEFLQKYKKKKYIKTIIYSFNFSCKYIYKKNIQIHTHICYSNIKKCDFKYINKMFVDVVSIESSKNLKKILKVIKNKKLLKKIEIGIGIYDVHSKTIPTINYFYKKIRYIIKNIGYKKIWINPDCGLKTRNYKEIINVLFNIKKAIIKIRKILPN